MEYIAEKLIFIAGGVGPMACVELHKRVIENTRTDGTDQSHLEVYHFSRSHDINDRTKYLLEKNCENPACGMARTFEIAYESIEKSGKQAVAGIPCNTFHSPEIYSLFLNLLKEKKVNIKVLNMIEETGNMIRKEYPEIRTIGLMSTTGTRKTMIYNQILGKDYNIVEVPDSMQDSLHDSIYNKEWGIKAKFPVTEKARRNFESYAKTLKEEGVEAIILGCTEIPLALPEKKLFDIPLIDPMTARARAIVSEANPEKLR